jgi:hypothetical protein
MKKADLEDRFGEVGGRETGEASVMASRSGGLTDRSPRGRRRDDDRTAEAAARP